MQREREREPRDFRKGILTFLQNIIRAWQAAVIGGLGVDAAVIGQQGPASPVARGGEEGGAVVIHVSGA